MSTVPLFEASLDTVPRVNKMMLQHYVAQQVTIVGEFQYRCAENPNHFDFLSSDHNIFTVIYPNMPDNFQGYNCKFVEVEGLVLDEKTIQQTNYQEWGNRFNMKTWNQFVILCQDLPALF